MLAVPVPKTDRGRSGERVFFISARPSIRLYCSTLSARVSKCTGCHLFHAGAWHTKPAQHPSPPPPPPWRADTRSEYPTRCKQHERGRVNNTRGESMLNRREFGEKLLLLSSSGFPRMHSARLPRLQGVTTRDRNVVCFRIKHRRGDHSCFTKQHFNIFVSFCAVGACRLSGTAATFYFPFCCTTHF